MLLPMASPRILVYADAVTKQLVRIDMVAAATSAASGGGQGRGTAVFQFGGAPVTTALSADGGSLCVSQRAHLLVFDTAQVLVEGPVADDPLQSLQPRARTAEPTGGGHVSDAAFSLDGGRLFALCMTGEVTVHDARHDDLLSTEVSARTSKEHRQR